MGVATLSPRRGVQALHAPTVSQRTYFPSLAGLEAAGRWLFGDNARRRFPLTRAWAIRDAERVTGLDDWGDPNTYDEPMQRLFDDFARWPPSFVGRIALRGVMGMACANRLRLQAATQTLGTAPMKPPLIIMGLHRTGSTLAQHLLSALPDHRFVPMWALISPTPSRFRRARASLSIRLSRLAAPELKIIHDIHPDGPEECWSLLMPTFRVFDFGFHWNVPSYAAWLDSQDMRPAYDEYGRTLRLLAQEFGGHLVMKGPGHLPSLRAILDALPEARVVWTHRRPETCIASFCSLSAVQHRTMYGTFDPVATGRRVLGRYGVAIDRATEALGHPRAEQVYHLFYEDLVADPVRAVRAVCESFGMPFGDDAKSRIQAAASARRAAHKQVHHYSLDQWGLEQGEIIERFRHYTDHFEIDVGPR